MISLPNGCSRSEITVFPDNWDIKPEKASERTVVALLKKEWRITYRFYDPAYKGTKLWGKLIPVKGMNKYKTLEERQDFTRSTLDELKELLDHEGFNPITKLCSRPAAGSDIEPDTFFPDALNSAYSKLKCSPGTTDDIRKALVHIQDAVIALRFHRLPVNEIRIRNCMMILEKVRETKHKKRDADLAQLKIDLKSGKVSQKVFVKERRKLERYNFGAASFNHYRSYLLMLFKIIVPLANMNGNPVKDIPKEKEIKRIRETLTLQQRKKVNEYLAANHYSFWRFMHIFFHSGARETEMVRVEAKHVDLENQRFKVLILKGTSYEEAWKPIKNIALPLWQEIMKEAENVKREPGQPLFIFSKGLAPGTQQINEMQITRRWRKHVKDNTALGNITADFYSLKHSNSTEIRKLMGAKAAAAINSHKSEAMVISIYDVEREKREMEELELLKEVNNPF